MLSPQSRANKYKKAQLSLTNPRDAKACQKLLQFDVLTTYFSDRPLIEALEFGDEIWRRKTRVLGLPDGQENMPLAFFFLTQYRRVTDRQTDGQTRCDLYNPR